MSFKVHGPSKKSQSKKSQRGQSEIRFWNGITRSSWPIAEKKLNVFGLRLNFWRP